MFKKMEKKPLYITLMILSTACLVGFSLFAIKFSSIYFILIGGFVGVVAYHINKASKEALK